MQKAFDTVSHDILLNKLYHYGIRGNAYRLLSSYLSGRKQFTKVGNFISGLVSILWGVTQGSVLGPLLFLIFINDLPNACSLFSWIFADDTALALSSKNFAELEIRFNSEINKAQDWLLANGLSVHYVDKTKYMLIKGPGLCTSKVGSETNFKLTMGRHEIERTDNYKYLGIYFDNKLSWKFQIDKMCSKLSSVCGVISKVRHYLDRKCLMLIYHSLFESRLRYGILAWGTASEHDLNRLRVLQNRVVRFISFASYTARAAHVYDKLKILPLTNQHLLQCTIFMHSFHYGTLPHTLSSYCQRPEHNQATRYNTNLNYCIPYITTIRGQSSIKFVGPKAWKEVPKIIKDIAFRKPFSQKMKEHILSDQMEMNKNLPMNSFNLRDFYGNTEGDNYTDLWSIFNSDDENTEFHGFDVCNLDKIFEDTFDEDYDFLGFDVESIEHLFTESENEDEFYGF